MSLLEWWSIHLSVCQQLNVRPCATSLDSLLAKPSLMSNWTTQNLHRFVLRKSRATGKKFDPKKNVTVNAGIPLKIKLENQRKVGSFVSDATVFFDGSCEPKNPGGTARAGWVINLLGVKHTGSAFIAESSTNNVAEFGALIQSAEHCKRLGVECPEFRGDSQLVCQVVGGSWRCKADGLKPFYQRAMELLSAFQCWSIGWIPRSKNSQADKLSNLQSETIDGAEVM